MNFKILDLIRGSIILVSNELHEKENNPNDKGVKKRHHSVKRYRNYTKVYMSTENKTLSPMWNFI